MSWSYFGGQRVYEPCYCGAEDCPECHPELQSLAECDCCGKAVPLWALSGDLCPECENMEKCPECGEWYDADSEHRCGE